MRGQDLDKSTKRKQASHRTHAAAKALSVHNGSPEMQFSKHLLQCPRDAQWLRICQKLRHRQAFGRPQLWGEEGCTDAGAVRPLETPTGNCHFAHCSLVPLKQSGESH